MHNESNLACCKKVKVNPYLSIMETWWGPHPKYYTPSPKDIGLLIPEEDIFKGFLPYLGMVTILFYDHLSCYKCIFLTLRSLHMTFEFNKLIGF